MQSILKRTSERLVWIFLILSLAGCGGGATIGGTLTGLAAGETITLQNNGTDSLTLSANGSFVFPSTSSTSTTSTTTTNTNTPYDVTILTEPSTQTCTVSGGSGTANSTVSEVTSVVVQCTSTSSLVVAVTGLSTGNSVNIQDTDSTALVTVTSNGVVPLGGVSTKTKFDILVSAPTNGQNCTAAFTSGLIVPNVAITIPVTCQ
jgi:hypothetical protein